MTRLKIDQFMEALGRRVRRPALIYLVGGSTAVLHGWRDSTIEIDLFIDGEPDEVLRRIPELKEELLINVELAAPHDFIPSLPGWEQRSHSIGHRGAIDFFHYDYESQALAKLERAHHQDLEDVRMMAGRSLIRPERLADRFEEIRDRLYRYPAVDAAAFEQRILAFIEETLPRESER
ncbi:MAG TPA: DUF6036 family nucleotidyltransferase [Thermoanaerobaculia bacterium]|nr:DUF6036 family nucleotidyltransferase [Thermoanaerobaculia bacterium]